MLPLALERLRPPAKDAGQLEVALLHRSIPPIGKCLPRRKADMKRARFSEEQISGVLKEAEAGAKVSELCRQHGISDASFYAWRSKYGGLEISEMRRLRQLEEEHRRLKSIVADQALDIRALKEVLSKNGYGPR